MIQINNKDMIGGMTMSLVDSLCSLNSDLRLFYKHAVSCAFLIHFAVLSNNM